MFVSYKDIVARERKQLTESVIGRSQMSVIVPNTSGLRTIDSYKSDTGDYYDFSSIPKNLKFIGTYSSQLALIELAQPENRGKELMSIKLRGVKGTAEELITADLANIELINITSPEKLLSASDLYAAGCGGQKQRASHELFINTWVSKAAFGISYENEKKVVKYYLDQHKSVVQYVNYVQEEMPWAGGSEGGPRSKTDYGFDCGSGVLNDIGIRETLKIK